MVAFVGYCAWYKEVYGNLYQSVFRGPKRGARAFGALNDADPQPVLERWGRRPLGVNSGKT